MELIIEIIIFGGLALVDLALWVLAAFLWVRQLRFLRRSVRVEGRVVGLRQSISGDHGGHAVYHPRVAFHDEQGRRHEVSSTAGGPDWDDMLDTPVDVLVIPGKPESAMVEFDKMRAAGIVSIIALGVSLATGFLLLLRMAAG